MARHIEDEVKYYYDSHPTEEDLMGETAFHANLPATTPSPGRLTGSSPAPTSATYCFASTPTSRPKLTPWQHDPHPRRTYEPDH
jgi:hypothetical protein